ncbi:unnamed protein product [Closterium sp. Naga37s-1]|nr:unnamed protein product [Closterium sp. Naga37s-1]
MAGRSLSPFLAMNDLFPSAPPACPGNDVELPRGGVSARAAEPDLRLSVGLSLGGGGAAAIEDGAKKPAKRKRADELPRAQTPESSGENSNLDTAAPPPPPAAPRPLFAFPPGGAPSASPQWLATVPPGNTARAAARRTHQSFHHGCGAVLPATPSPDDVPGGGWMGAGDGRVPVGVGSPVEGRAGGLSGTGSAGGSGGEQEEGLDAQEAGGKSSRPRTVAERKRRNGISLKLEQLKRAIPQCNTRVTTETLLCSVRFVHTLARLSRPRSAMAAFVGAAAVAAPVQVPTVKQLSGGSSSSRNSSVSARCAVPKKLGSEILGTQLSATSCVQAASQNVRARSVEVRAVATEAPTKMSRVVKWDQEKRLQTQTTTIAADTTTIRSLDWDRDRFDIEFGLLKGTTYNSFLIRGANKVALIDASHEKFRELYLSALKAEIDIKDIDYVIANHTEPDHSGLIRDLIELNPNITVVGSKVCIQFLQNLVLKPFKSLVAQPGKILDLGGGHELDFIMAPNLHWPDTMFTFDKGTGVMFTCDAFGSHYCSEKVYDEDLSELEPHYRFYYDCLMKPNSRSVLTALRKVASAGWEFSEIAVGHGPLLRYNVPELTLKYEQWSKAAIEKQKSSIAVLYVSDYGYSDRLSQCVARGITKAGAGVEMMDLKAADTQELVECIGRNAAVVLMMPPTTGPAAAAVAPLVAGIKTKQSVLLCESYGGDDEPVDTLMYKFNDRGVKMPIEPLRIKEPPTEAVYQLFEEAGTDLGQGLTQKAVREETRRSMSLAVAKAIARVSGGLYVVAASKGSSRGAMIASWVSQASFKPLGITVAVAKDRAIESLMQVGDSFVLNCLEEGNFAPLMKHFLKRFPPGADRFEGVDWDPASNGSPVLAGALAFLECTVVSRMETNDHWITYAEVTAGKVSKPEGRTASHHRKLGDYY